MERMPLAEAAQRLGLTVDATRKRIKRGLLPADKDEDGRWFVTLADPSDVAGVDKRIDDLSTPVNQDLRDEIAFLRERLREADQERAELRRMLNLEQQNVARLLPATTPDAPRAPERPAEDESHVSAPNAPPGGAGAAEQAPEKPQRWPWWMRILAGK